MFSSAENHRKDPITLAARIIGRTKISMSDTKPFLDDLRRAVRASGPVSEPAALWLEKVDEEIALITWLLALEYGDKRQYVSESWLSSISPPLGYGRSTSELLEELDRCGVVKRAGEDSFDEWTKKNASWEFGRMFYSLYRHMDAAGLLDKDKLHEEGSRLNELVSLYGYYGHGKPTKNS